MDISTLEQIAKVITGEAGTLYRSGGDLTRFFEKAGVNRFRHDGSTRHWWTLDALKACTEQEIRSILLRLANPLEYNGNAQAVADVVPILNQVLRLEGTEIYLEGAKPRLRDVPITFTAGSTESELKPLPAPDFARLNLEPQIAMNLAFRWDEVERCIKSEACLAATIIMGSLLEGLLLAVLLKFPKQANCWPSSPKDNSGKVKPFHEWKLSEMIDFAHNEGLVDLDVKRFSHSLREFRNLIHPYQQVTLNVTPDLDTANICWLVVQAATNDLARNFAS